jgi:hypothetical protein
MFVSRLFGGGPKRVFRAVRRGWNAACDVPVYVSNVPPDQAQAPGTRIALIRCVR